MYFDSNNNLEYMVTCGRGRGIGKSRIETNDDVESFKFLVDALLCFNLRHFCNKMVL
jgi:hypothetical protein